MTVTYIFVLCSLILLPAVVFLLARTRVPRHTFAATGAALGVVITPWAFGLYSLFALGPLWALFGFLGLALVWFHEPPGFHLAMFLEVVSRDEVISGTDERFVIEAINAVIWAFVYGLLGAGIDLKRRRDGQTGQPSSGRASVTPPHTINNSSRTP